MTIVAAIQMTSSTTVSDNLATTAHWIANAAKQQAKLVVLPENFALMAQNKEQLLQQQECFGQGVIQDFLADQARRHHIWIVGGTIPISHDDKQHVRSACLVFSAEGKCVARYDKIHLFDVIVVPEKEEYHESEKIAPGQEIVTIDSPFGKLGLAVCYDVRFPELFRQLLLRDAEIFLLPSAFTVPTGKAHWEVLNRARAIENGAYMIAAAQVGKHANGRETYGHSMIIDPWGKILAVLPQGEGLILAEINLDYLRDVRTRLPMRQHLRLSIS